jgi:hypothetical protein
MQRLIIHLLLSLVSFIGIVIDSDFVWGLSIIGMVSLFLSSLIIDYIVEIREVNLNGRK